MALVAMGLAVFVVANDFTALSVALPTIERQFHTTLSTVQWVINAYALVFGVLIVTGGRLSDMFGRKLMFFAGSAIFAAFSVLGGLAPNVVWLIVARALMGIGGALMWPATLGMTYGILPKSKAGLAGGLIVGVAGIGNAVGPLLGGALTDLASWRWVLLLNLPVAAIACFVTSREVERQVEPGQHERIDYWGITTLSLGLTAVLVALDQGSVWGFGDPRIIALFVVFAVAMIAFPWIEHRMGDEALMPPELWRHRQFLICCAMVPLLGTGFFSLLLYMPQYMQKLLGYSPLRAGVGLLPMMIVFGAVSFVAGGLYQRLGPRLSTSGGAAFMAVGLFIVSLLTTSTGYGLLAVGLTLFGIGTGLFFSSATTAGVTSLDPSHASLAGAILYMFQIAGASIGLGLITAIFTASAKSQVHHSVVVQGLSGAQEHAVNGIIQGSASTHSLLAPFPQAHAALSAVAHQAFAGGVQTAFQVTTAFALVACVVLGLFIKGRPRLREAAAAEPSAAVA